MRNDTDYDWTDATIATLRRLWSEGHSTAEIGRRRGISKNAVIGKAHRLALPGRRRSSPAILPHPSPNAGRDRGKLPGSPFPAWGACKPSFQQYPRRPPYRDRFEPHLIPRTNPRPHLPPASSPAAGRSVRSAHRHSASAKRPPRSANPTAPSMQSSPMCGCATAGKTPIRSIRADHNRRTITARRPHSDSVSLTTGGYHVSSGAWAFP